MSSVHDSELTVNASSSLTPRSTRCCNSVVQLFGVGNFSFLLVFILFLSPPVLIGIKHTTLFFYLRYELAKISLVSARRYKIQMRISFRTKRLGWHVGKAHEVALL
jgi:hypothetical protein